MKICIIGGGSSYTPELIEGFIHIQQDVRIDEIAMLDIPASAGKFQIVTDLAQRMLKKTGSDIQLAATLTPQEAIEGADFIIHQFRPGRLEGRITDEKIPLNYNLIGQETTGMGGMACGLRAFSLIEQYVEMAKTWSNNAWIINFTNPSGMLTEFIRNYLHYERTIGLCNVPINFLVELQKMFVCQRKDIFLKYYGLNHLSWIEQIQVNGVDRSDELWQGFQMNMKNIPDTEYEPEFIAMLKLLPNPYLRYYYQTDQMLESEIGDLNSKGTRGEVVSQVEQELFKLYADPELDKKPPQLEQRGGFMYSTVATELIRDLITDARSIHIINTRNEGAIEDFPNDYVMEIPAKITRQGPETMQLGQSHQAVTGLISTIKNFERLTIEAYTQTDENRVRQAMLIHPLGPSASQSEALWQDLKQANDNFGRFAPQ